MSLSPKTLFNTTLDFVSSNVENIECLNGFPEIVGKGIFDRFIILSELASVPSEKQVKVISMFIKAYREFVLESISLSEGLILINEYFDSFVALLHFTTELCLCSCYLGDNHELFEYIQNLGVLKKLCLKNNCLKDGAIRKITLPIRMFNKGPKDIEFLDLSDNQLTDAIVPWLAVFQKIQCLDLSGSILTKNGVEALEKKCVLKLCNSDSEIHPITTKGWAIPLVQKWNDICMSRRTARKIKKQNSYFSKKRCTMAEENIFISRTNEKSSNKMVFKRAPHLYSSHSNNTSYETHSKNVSRKLLLNPEAIEKDIFAQYLKPAS